MRIVTELSFTRTGNTPLQGQNSEVYFVHDEQLSADLVVKQVPKAIVADPARYFAEAAMLYEARHPNVVEVKYACQTADHICFAMPRYRTSLEGVLRHQRLTVRQIVKIGVDFLSGLHHIHTRGLLHFDIKPSNVLIDDAGRAVVTDFGLSQPAGPAGLATPPQLYGKHHPPEALTTSPSLSIKSDIYQAGLTLYRMCTGLAVFEAEWQALVAQGNSAAVAAISEGSFPSRHTYPAHIPARLQRLIATALAVNPDDRFGSVLDMLNELAQVTDCLDWEYTPALGPLPAGQWAWRSGDPIRHVVIEPDGAMWRVRCWSESAQSGKVRQSPGDNASGLTSAKAVSTALKRFARRA